VSHGEEYRLDVVAGTIILRRGLKQWHTVAVRKALRFLGQNNVLRADGITFVTCQAFKMMHCYDVTRARFWLGHLGHVFQGPPVKGDLNNSKKILWLKAHN